MLHTPRGNPPPPPGNLSQRIRTPRVISNTPIIGRPPMPGARAVLPSGVGASPRLRQTSYSLTPRTGNGQLDSPGPNREVEPLRRPNGYQNPSTNVASPAPRYQQGHTSNKRRNDEDPRRQSKYGRTYKPVDRYQP